MKGLIILLLVFLGSAVVASPMDTFVFDSPEQEALFNKLSNELRCLVCQNQSIADSNAGLATDLRTEMHRMVQAGKSEDEIVDFMVQRYGDYVLYRPPFKPSTWLLWFAPIIAFLIGLIYVVRVIRQQNNEIGTGELSNEEAERLNSLQAESTMSNNETGSQK